MTGGQYALDRFLSNDRAPATGHTKAGIFFMILSALLGFIAVIFLALSLNAYLLTQYTPDIAALVTALSTLLAAIFSLAVGLMFFKFQRRHAVTASYPASDPLDVIKELAVLGGEDIQRLIQDNPKTAVALASILGAVIARR